MLSFLPLPVHVVDLLAARTSICCLLQKTEVGGGSCAAISVLILKSVFSDNKPSVMHLVLVVPVRSACISVYLVTGVVARESV